MDLFLIPYFLHHSLTRKFIQLEYLVSFTRNNLIAKSEDPNDQL